MKIQTTGKDCRVKIPVEAHEWKEAENERRKAGTTERLLPITLVMEAILAVGLGEGDKWKDVAIEMGRQQKTPLTNRGRQPKQKNVT